MADNFDPQADDAEAQRRALLSLAGQGSVVAQDPQYANQLPSETESTLRGASQEATLGWGDEASGALGALFPSQTDTELNKSYPERYQQITNDIRQQNQTAQQANPKSYLGGQVAGGLSTAAAIPGLAGGGLLANSAKVAGTLGTYGAAQGAGEAEEGQRLQGAYEGAKGALEAPLKAAGAVKEAVEQGSPGGTVASGGLLALSILPFALKGAPINEFVIQRADAEINQLTKAAKQAIKNGEFDNAQEIVNQLRKQSDENNQAWKAYQQKRFAEKDPAVMEQLTKSQYDTAALSGRADGAANHLDRDLAYQKNKSTPSIDNSPSGKIQQVQNLLGIDDKNIDLFNESANFIKKRALEDRSLSAEDIANELKTQINPSQSKYNPNDNGVGTLMVDHFKKEIADPNTNPARKAEVMQILRNDYGINPSDISQDIFAARREQVQNTYQPSKSLEQQKAEAQSQYDQMKNTQNQNWQQSQDKAAQAQAEKLGVNAPSSVPKDLFTTEELTDFNRKYGGIPQWAIDQRQQLNANPTRTVIPSDVFQARLNALRKLQGK